MRVHGVRLIGTGAALPREAVASRALDARHGLAEGWIERRCGVRRRFVCRGETQEVLAAAAIRQCLARAGREVREVDLLIAACGVGRQPIPATAPAFAREAGIAPGRCVSFDVNSTCLGFLTGLDVAEALLRLGRHRTALVVSAEVASRALPWDTDPATAGLFGDGAAAALLVRGGDERSCLRASLFETHHDGYELCSIPAGGTAVSLRDEPERFRAGSTFRMDGHGLFRLVAQRFPRFLDRLLAAAGWQRDEVDLVVPHQASPLALRHLAERCGFAAGRIVDIIADHGNQVAASIPFALHAAFAAGRIAPGARVLMLGTSAGVGFGGIAMEAL